MSATPDLLKELHTSRLRRLENQHRFPEYFTACACEHGCGLCGQTGKVSKATARQLDQEFARSSDAVAFP